MDAGPNIDHTAIDSYDPLGRPLAKRQIFKRNGVTGPTYSISQTYDIPGNVKTLIYPSSRIVSYSHDQAGRLTNFSGSLGDGVNRTYSTITQFHAAGMIERETPIEARCSSTMAPMQLRMRTRSRMTQPTTAICGGRCTRCRS